jgi:transposase
MYIRKTTSTVRSKTYTNYLLVESVSTPKGPRQKTICSLGSLEPRPARQWLELARKIEHSLCGQQTLFPNQDSAIVDGTVEKIRSKAEAPKLQPAPTSDRYLRVDVEEIQVEDAREAGAVYVGATMYERLGIDAILRECGLGSRTRLLTKVMVINRLVYPLTEHAMPDWVGRTALADIVGADLERLSDAALYRTMGKLHRHRSTIEKKLRRNEHDLFGLHDTIMLYDLTSHYFEGQCPFNPQARLGYSRDNRPDCKQVVVGVVYDGEGFPYCHRVFDGNTQDSTTLAGMLATLKAECGAAAGAQQTVVVDRGMAFDENIRQIKDAGFHYIVAARQQERTAWLTEFEDATDYHEIIRTPSPRNPAQKKSHVEVKKIVTKDELIVLCISDGRKQKDRAIRLRFEARMKKDVEKLNERIQNGRLTDEKTIYERIGRIKERYPRVARYYQLEYDKASETLRFQCLEEKRTIAEKLDGGYILKTDRLDMSDEQIWRTYMLLTRAENAFRNMKSPLSERPIFHHFEDRVQVHIFLCILAYHLLAAIEKLFQDKGIHTSWNGIRDTLATHQMVTVALPTDGEITLRIRKPTKPEQCHQEIYDVLGMSSEIARARKLGKIKNSD